MSFPSPFNLNTLNGINGFAINGINRGDQSGGSVSGAGDVNGDGIDDILIGALEGNGVTGQSYVLFGSKSGWSASINLSSLNGNNGFVINGITKGDYSGCSVNGAGDVNGDGIDDILIGAYGANRWKGQSYMLFGSRSVWPQSISLARLNGNNGFAINGINSMDNSGGSVSGAGDVNNDGIDDILIGAPAYASARMAGQSYVLFGSSGWSAALNLSSLNGNNGFAINGIGDGHSGWSVSGAGDVNNDGIDDILIGAPQAFYYYNAGQSYVLFGSSSGWSATLNLSRLNGNNGFAINGGKDDYDSGCSVSRAGDVNNDGIDDILIGSSGIGEMLGHSYVLFGSRSAWSATISLSSLNGNNGFAINGIKGGDSSGQSVSRAGDVNNDGIDDILMGAPGANGGTGQSYVLFGSRRGWPPAVNLSSINSNNGFAVNGIHRGDKSGWSVSGAGDVNNDGIDDVLIGAPGANGGAGQTYVLFGSADEQNYCMISYISDFGPIGTQPTGGISIGETEGWCKSDALFMGDFNGDGRTDLLCSLADGQNSIMLSQGTPQNTSFTSIPFSRDPNGKIHVGINDRWCSKVTQQLLIGDFNGDKKSDLLCHGNANVNQGQNYIMLSNGTGFISMSGSQDGSINVGPLGRFCFINQRLVVGNFDGLSGDDLLCNDPDPSRATNKVMLSNGTAFNPAIPMDPTGTITTNWQGSPCSALLWCSGSDSSIFSGYFNADNKTDLLCNIQSENKIMLSTLPVTDPSSQCAFQPIPINPTTGPGTQQNGSLSMGDGTRPYWCDTTQSRLVVGDINGDTLSDLICNTKGVNQIMLCKPDGVTYYKFDAFNENDPTGDGTTQISNYDKWCVSQNLFTGDFNFDGGPRKIYDLWCNQDGGVIGASNDLESALSV